MLTAAGCSDRSSQLQQIDQGVSSWAQTLRTAGALWLEQKVPAKYLRQTTDAADDSLAKLAKQLEGIDLPSKKKDDLRPRLQSLAQAVSQIRLDLAGDDREKMKQTLAALDAPSRRSEGS
jgi:hypothetical protein